MINRIFYIILIFLISCGGSANTYAPAIDPDPEEQHYIVTKEGQKVKSYGWLYDPDEIDHALIETAECMGVQEYSTDIFITLKEPYAAFPCVPLPDGCGGLFELNSRVTVSADLVRLQHEYVHYFLYSENGDPDASHESDYFETCS